MKQPRSHWTPAVFRQVIRRQYYLQKLCKRVSVPALAPFPRLSKLANAMQKYSSLEAHLIRALSSCWPAANQQFSFSWHAYVHSPQDSRLILLHAEEQVISIFASKNFIYLWITFSVFLCISVHSTTLRSIPWLRSLGEFEDVKIVNKIRSTVKKS